MDEEEVMSETLDRDSEDTEETESTENEKETEEESTEETTEEEEGESIKLEEDEDEKSSRRTGTLINWFALLCVVSAASRKRSNRTLRDLPDEDETDASSIM